MAPGLSVLIQGVLEFVPLIVELMKSRYDKDLTSSRLFPAQNVQDVVQRVNAIGERRESELSFEQAKKQQQQIALDSRETQFKLAALQRETALKLPETRKVLDNWPLGLYPSQILASHPLRGVLPLRIFLAFPGDRIRQHTQTNLNIESRLAQGLRTFLGEHYPLHDPTRPTEFLAGAWKSEQFHSEASIKVLFELLKSEPTLILESDVDHQNLNFRIAYWGLGQENYYYKTVAEIPYQTLFDEAAKAQAFVWKTTRDRLLELGEDIDTINQLGGQQAANLELLEQEEKWTSMGVDVSQLRLPYRIDDRVLAVVCQTLIRYHCLMAAWVADTYHLVYRDVPPLLPALLPELTQDRVEFSLLQAISKGYQQMYQALEDERRYWVPELALQLAQSLSHLPEKSWAAEQIEFSILIWLKLRGMALEPGESALEAMRSVVRVGDRDYLTTLIDCLAAVEDRQAIAALEEMLHTLQYLAPESESESLPASIQGIGSLIQTLPDYSGKRASLALSPDGDTVIGGSVNDSIQMWNVSTGEPLRSFKGQKDLSSVALSADGHYLASSSLHSSKSNVRIWDVQTGALLHERLGHKKSVGFVAMDRVGRILSGSGDKVKIWDIKTGKRLGTFSHPCPVNTAAVSPNGQILATGDSQGTIRLWTIKSGETLRTLRRHTAAINALTIDPNGELLISASADQTIRIWQMNTGKLVYTLDDHAGAVNAIALQVDRQLLISGSSDTTLKFWSLKDWEVLHTLSPQSGAIVAIALSANGQVLASGSVDKTIKVWQL